MMGAKQNKRKTLLESEAEPAKLSLARWISLVILTVGGAFFAELLAHGVVASLNLRSTLVAGTLNALLVALMLVPPLYLLWVRPAFALTRENQLARTLLEEFGDAMPEAVMMLTPDLRIIWANQAAVAEQATDRKQSVLGRTCYAVTHDRDTPCDGKDHECPIDRLTDKQREASLLHTHWDGFGMPRRVEVSIVPVKGEDGTVQRYIHLSKDVTENIRAKKHLEQLDNATSKLIERVGNAVLVTDDDGVTLYANDAAASLVGLSAEQLEGEVLVPGVVEDDTRVSIDLNFQSKALGRADVLSTGAIWDGQPARFVLLESFEPFSQPG